MSRTRSRDRDAGIGAFHVKLARGHAEPVDIHINVTSSTR